MSLQSRLTKIENELKAQNKPGWQMEIENLVRSGTVTLDDVIDDLGSDAFNIWPGWFVLVSEADKERARKADEKIEADSIAFEQSIVESIGVETYNVLSGKFANHELTTTQFLEEIKKHGYTG